MLHYFCVKVLRGGALAAALGVSIIPCLALDTIYLVRHAEKTDFWPDDLDDYRPLSPAGQARAEALERSALAGAGIVAVYASRTTRALATGMPIAQRKHIPITASRESADAEAISSFLTSLKERHPGRGAVLIVGHSNTVPLLLVLLGAEPACYERLGIERTAEGLRIEGYDDLWRADLAGKVCSRLTRRSQKRLQAPEGASSPTRPGRPAHGPSKTP